MSDNEQNELLQWWGYLHVNNTLKVKPFFDYEDIRCAKESTFVKHVFEPFNAENYDEAVKYIEKQLEVIYG